MNRIGHDSRPNSVMNSISSPTRDVAGRHAPRSDGEEHDDAEGGERVERRLRTSRGS